MLCERYIRKMQHLKLCSPYLRVYLEFHRTKMEKVVLFLLKSFYFSMEMHLTKKKSIVVHWVIKVLAA